MQHLQKYTKSMFEGQGVRPGHNPTKLLVVVSLWIATVGNAALWLELYKNGRLHTGADFLIAIGLAVLAATGLVAGTALLAWRRSIKPLLVLLLIIAALSTYFMLSTGAVIDQETLRQLSQADLSKISTHLNGPLIAALLIIAGLPILWLRRQQVQHWGWRKQLLRNLAVSILASIIAVGGLLALQPKITPTEGQARDLRYVITPLNWLFANLQEKRT
jgi:lipid A ethanolaminephosphotransferase